MKAGESMRRNFAQILKDAKIDIKVSLQYAAIFLSNNRTRWT